MSADIYEELIANSKAWRPVDSYDAATTEAKRAALLVSRAAAEINRLRCENSILTNTQWSVRMNERDKEILKTAGLKYQTGAFATTVASKEAGFYHPAIITDGVTLVKSSISFTDESSAAAVAAALIGHASHLFLESLAYFGYKSDDA